MGRESRSATLLEPLMLLSQPDSVWVRRMRFATSGMNLGLTLDDPRIRAHTRGNRSRIPNAPVHSLDTEMLETPFDKLLPCFNAHTTSSFGGGLGFTQATFSRI